LGPGRLPLPPPPWAGPGGGVRCAQNDVPPTAVFRCESSREVASGARDGLGSVHTDRWCGWEERRPGVLIPAGRSVSCQDVAFAVWLRWAASAARSKGTKSGAVAARGHIKFLGGFGGERARPREAGRIGERVLIQCKPGVH
jgi:hypothetical protein